MRWVQVTHFLNLWIYLNPIFDGLWVEQWWRSNGGGDRERET